MKITDHSNITSLTDFHIFWISDVSDWFNYVKALLKKWKLIEIYLLLMVLIWFCGLALPFISRGMFTWQPDQSAFCEFDFTILLRQIIWLRKNSGVPENSVNIRKPIECTNSLRPNNTSRGCHPLELLANTSVWFKKNIFKNQLLSYLYCLEECYFFK